MGSLEERIRQLQEEERIKKQREATATAQHEQVARAASQAADQASLNAEVQERNRRMAFTGILDEQQVAQKLEEVRNKIWRGEGTVVSENKGLSRVVALVRELPTEIPEYEIKSWEKSVTEWVVHDPHPESGSIISRNETRRVGQSSKSVKEWHKVIKPTYLEVGVEMGNPAWLSGAFPATLYIIDTEVDLDGNGDAFYALSDKAKKAASEIGGLSARDIQYKDRSGNSFNTQARSHKMAGWSNVTRNYELHQFFHSGRGIALGLKPGLDRIVINDFLSYGLALSSLLRRQQGKLALQLK